ncbi:MAG: hypothetical protein WC322_01440 [Candidatus Paceibacterota bacterium]|jgi:hypothetical protein
MSVVVSSSIVIAQDTEYALSNANNPLIGYQNLTTINNITASWENALFPATNLANVSTSSLWKSGGIGEVYIDIIVDTAELVDYVGIARHNFGSGNIPVSIYGLVDNLESPTNYVELVDDVLLPNDGPALFRFTPQALYGVRIRLQAGDLLPQAAVVYVGKLLVLQRRIYVGHTPINYGRRTNIVSARSESGNFLGRVIVGESTETSVLMKNITASWYRNYLDAFVVDAQENPFFFAWRPSTYPREVGYAWLTGDPKPVNSRVNGMMEIDLKMNGIV